MERFLLSYRFKIPGIILIAAGAVLAVIYFSSNIRVEFPVFAVYSSYVETKTFAIFRTNIADELVMLSFLAGLFILAFSKEKTEKKIYSDFRSRSLAAAFLINMIIIAFSIIFVYGSGFIGMLILNVYSFPVIYLAFFNILKLLHR